MADNVTITPGSGTSIAADDIGSVMYQRMKITRGIDGSSKGDAGTYGSTVSLLSTALNSLASSSTAGYASAEVDMTAECADDVWLYAKFAMHSTPAPTGLIEVYLVVSNDGTDYTGDTTYSGTAAAYTLGGAGSLNLTPAFYVKPHAVSGTYRGACSLKAVLGGVPPFFAVVVANNSATALNATGSEITYRARY